MNQDYQNAIRRMIFWRRAESSLLWTALGLPLVLFLHVPTMWLLLGWFVLLILTVIAHFNRKTARNAAAEAHDYEHDETDSQ